MLVHNVAAGHNLPTGVTELRQMWVDLRILDADGKQLFRSGDLDEQGEIRPNAIRFGAVAADKTGKATVKLWEMTRFLWKRTVPPKAFTRDTIGAQLPAGVAGKLTVEAKLLYRSASPLVVKRFMREKAFTPKIIEMAAAKASVSVE